MIRRIFLIAVVLAAMTFATTSELQTEEQHNKARKAQKLLPPATGVGNQDHSAQEAKERRDTKQESDKPTTITIEREVSVRSDLYAQEAQARAKQQAKPWWEKSEWWSVFVTAAAALFAYLAFRAASRQAKVAEDALESSNTSFNETLAEMKAQSSAMQAFADAAKISSDIARESLEISQAANVFPQNVMIDTAKEFLLVTVENSGHLPATKLRINVEQFWIKYPKRCKPGEKALVDKSSRNATLGDTPIPPNSRTVIGLRVHLLDFAKENIVEFDPGMSIFFATVHMQYQNGFRDVDAHYAYIYVSEGPAPGFCPMPVGDTEEFGPFIRDTKTTGNPA